MGLSGHLQAEQHPGADAMSLTSCRSFPRMVGNTARGASLPEKPTLLQPEP